jgi:peptidoglycan biosynthesis protein MviN/MurJ (putative lipid II flippase)
MIWLLNRHVGTLRGHGIGQTLFKSALASAIMGGAVYAVMRGAAYMWPVAGRMRWAFTVVGGGGIGLLVYLFACALLRLPELALARTLVGQVIQKVLDHGDMEPPSPPPCSPCLRGKEKGEQ